MYTESVLIIYKFHICEFADLLKFVTRKSILTALPQSSSDMHRAVRNLSPPIHIFPAEVKHFAFLLQHSYCKQVSFSWST